MKNLKKGMVAVLVSAMVWSMAACGSGNSSGTTQSSSTGVEESTAAKAASSSGGDVTVLRLANSHNAEHITSQACQRFADSVKKKTNGRIVIETHFSGELGDERSTIEQCQFGGLDFTRVSSEV